MHSLLGTRAGQGGIYVAMFLFALRSGVFPLASSEAAMIGLGAASSYGWPQLLVLAGIVAIGQSVTHAMVFQSGRGLAHAGATRSPALEARLVKARALGVRWENSERLLIALGATVGIPPQVLIALLAGAIGIRLRTFVAIDVSGRILRFTTIVVVAHLA